MSRTHHHRRRPRVAADACARIVRVHYRWTLPDIPWPACKAFDARLRRVLDAVRPPLTVNEGRHEVDLHGPPGPLMRATKARLRKILGPTVDEQRAH